MTGFTEYTHYDAMGLAALVQTRAVKPEEVLEARFIPVDQVLLEIQQKPYCPDSLAALKRYLRARGSDVAKEA